MKQTKVLQEIRLIRFIDTYDRWTEKRLTQAEAASLLGMCERTFRRYCRKRERAPMKGMMLHQDGSTHEWVPNTHWDLIVTMDDATSEIYFAFFVDEEGTFSSFQGVQDVILNHDLFCSFYSDWGSHYWTTPTAAAKSIKPTYSPEARGRSERMFGTLQQRLSKELALAGITSMDNANCFLKGVYLLQHNQRFGVKPAQKESVFAAWLNSGTNLQDILCIQEQRNVCKDNTVSYKGKTWQIPKQQHRCHYIKAKVRVHAQWPTH